MLVRNHLLCPYSDCEANKRSGDLRIQVVVNEDDGERTVSLGKTLKGEKENTSLPYRYTKEVYDAECSYCQRPVEVVIDETHSTRYIHLRQGKESESIENKFSNVIEITENQLQHFRAIRDKFQNRTKFPEPNNWEELSDNDVWLRIVAQVMVVGRSSPYEKFIGDGELKKVISYESLSKAESDYELARTINHVLLVVGTRYAQPNPNKCLKTQALVHNFREVSKEGGPVAFLKKLSQFQEDRERVQFVIDSFKFIKNKGARDFLMRIGILKDAIALDVRIQKIFRKLGITFLKDFSYPRVYDQIEKDILLKVCKPLGISGVELDRMLYRNYNEIMNTDYRVSK